MAENTIDNLSIQVTTSADEAARIFDRLASGMSRIRNVASGTASGMRNTANAAEDMANAVEDAGMATANAGTQTGYAESHIRRFARALMTTSSQTIGRFVTAVNRGASAVGGFIRQIARVLMYRSIRSMLKDLGQSFRDLYGWSRMFGTDFAKSMDRINTSAVYLRNSFAAMVAPVINALAPAIDVIADKIVDIFNFVNQIFAALSGAETYTVAKKVAQTWESTFDSASSKAKKTVKEIRNTLLGFDEINRLNGNTPTSTGSTGSSPYTPGYNSMFEEKPLEGFFKKISDFTSKMPDWLKWLFGGATLVGGFLLLKKFLPWLLEKIGELFSLKIPNWLKWLFGPKGDGNNGINIPDHIDLPDSDIDVSLKKGDWSLLDDIKPIDITANLKRGWPGTVLSYLNLNYVVATITVNLVRGWEGTVLSFLNLNYLEAKVTVDIKRGWVGTVLSYLNLTSLATKVTVDLVRKWKGTVLSYLNLNRLATKVTVDLERGWEGTVLSYLNLNYLETKVKVDLVRKWVGTVLSYLNLNNLATAVTVDLVRSNGWKNNTALAYLNIANLATNVVVDLVRSDGWKNLTALAYLNIANLATSVSVDIVRANSWKNLTALAYLNVANLATQVVVDLVRSDGWKNLTALAYLNISQLKTSVTVDLKKGDGWDLIDGFGGATGGGGTTSGGGVGRSSKVSVSAVLDRSKSDDAAVNALTTGSYSKSVNMAVNVTGMDSSYGGDIFVDDSGITGATSSITGLLNAFSSLKTGLTKTLKINVQQGDDLPEIITTALTFASGLKKILKIGINKDGNINDTVANAVDAPDTNLKGINVALGTDQKKSDNTAINAFANIGKTVSVKISAIVSALSGATKAIADFFGISQKKALGGIYSNGLWSSIPQYAGGTLNAHGSLFLAGEAGPEIVGHIGGRTEVLNKSQIASAMYSAVKNAMSGITLDANIYGSSNAEFDYDAMYQAMYDAFVAALSRSDERDREKLALMREIAAKDFDLEITASSLNKAQTRMNRRAGITIVPVGT